MIDALLQDLRYTFRTLRRDAGFAAFAVAIVGLGIGASSAVFSVVNTLLIRPLPFRDAGSLVWIANHDVSGLSGQTTQVGHLLDLREKSKTFADIAGYFAFNGIGGSVLTGDGEPERLTGVPVSENFFQLLGVTPQVGRLFTQQECLWNGPKAVLISHGLWERRFGGNPAIVGRSLRINDQATTVAGVLPESFDFSSVFAPASHVDLYFPFPLSQETNRWGNTMAMVGRLKPGADIAAARAEIKVLAPQITKAHPERNDFEGVLSPLAEHVSGRMHTALVVLACAVGVVMLIVCANLSNLLLARTAARHKEIAIRNALGASRGRLIRQVLTESVVLSCTGAIAGLAFAFAATRALAHLDAMSIPMLASVRLDGTALLFTLAAAVATGVVFGLAPAFQTPAGALHDALKENSRGATDTKGRGWIRGALVVSEIAFACVLLVGAGLLMRSFLRVLDVNLGFRPERAAAMRIQPSRRFQNQAQQNAYIDEVLRLARTVPGIQKAALTDVLPLGVNRTWGAGEKGHTYPKGQYPLAYVRIVSDSYFEAMGIPLREGRDFNARDNETADLVMMVNETFARTMWPGQSAIGKIINQDGGRRIVGVVGDVRHLTLEQGSGMEMYIPSRQTRDFGSPYLLVRTSLPPGELASGVRAALLSLEPNLPRNDFRTLQQLVDKSVSPRRFVVMLLGGFALFALVLASLGIYAVISYSVGRRTQEIGIRMALGASSRDLQAGIILQTLGLAAIGIVAGGFASWVLARALSGMLYGVTASDPATFAGMVVVLTGVAALAGYLPARRASRIDPMAALRAD